MGDEEIKSFQKYPMHVQIMLQAKSRTLSRASSVPNFNIKKVLPPITRHTFKFLSFKNISNDVQTRHEMIFDPKFKFKSNPNLLSCEKVQNYWKLLSRCFLGEEPLRVQMGVIPIMLHEISVILLDLVATSDRDSFLEILNDRMDINELKMQMRNNSINYSAIILNFYRIMKDSCAPIRDGDLNKMITEATYTERFRKCFEIIELMYIDMANYDLESMRPDVLRYGIQYEKSYFDEIGLPLVKLRKRMEKNNGSFWRTFVDVVSSNLKTEELPEIFILDVKRIQTLSITFNTLTFNIAKASTLLLYDRQASLNAKFESLKIESISIVGRVVEKCHRKNDPVRQASERVLSRMLIEGLESGEIVNWNGLADKHQEITVFMNNLKILGNWILAVHTQI